MFDRTFAKGKNISGFFSLCVFALVSYGSSASAQESQDEIAKKLNNPIADLVSVPFQFNFDHNIGPMNEAERWSLNIQPVIPVSISPDWNVVSRTIVPIIGLNDVPPGNEESGLGDIFQSFFFSPKEPTATGWIWGVGPALLFPSASDELLGAEKWAAGPTAVFLRQDSGWTYGALSNHVWSYAGEDDREDVSATFLQPFLAFTTKTFTTLTINTESTYDWQQENWSAPVNLLATQLFKIGNQPMSIQIGARYWIDSPDSGPEGWGFRIAYTLVIPKN